IVLAPEGVVGALAALGRRLWPAQEEPPSASLPPQPRRPAAATGKLLEASGMTKRFGGIEALCEAGVVLGAGGSVGSIGPNGSGKTTLINAITGLVRLDAGTICLDGADIAGLAPHEIARRGVARSFQMGTLVDGMSALETVATAHLAATGGISLRRALV